LVEWRLAGETEVLGETCPSATLSTISTWLDPGLNQGRRGGKPATNHLSYGAAWTAVLRGGGDMNTDTRLFRLGVRHWAEELAV
jgi:hypothetical protein